MTAFPGNNAAYLTRTQAEKIKCRKAPYNEAQIAMPAVRGEISEKSNWVMTV